MKFQVLLLISLACFSSLVQTFDFNNFAPTGDAVEIDGVSFQVGKDDDNECGVRRTEGTDATDYSFTSSPSADACTPIGIFQTGNGVWVVLQKDGSQEILSAANLFGTNQYSDVFPVDEGKDKDAVVVGKINTAAGADFGKFTGGAFLGSVKDDGTFGGLEVSEIDVCKNVIRIQVSTEADFEVIGADGNAIEGATGDDRYLSFDTANAGVSVSETLEECEEEEEEEEDNSAGILSVASALLAVFGVVAL